MCSQTKNIGTSSIHHSTYLLILRDFKCCCFPNRPATGDSENAQKRLPAVVTLLLEH